MIVDYHMHLRDPEERIEHTTRGSSGSSRPPRRGASTVGFTEHVYYFRQTIRYGRPYQTERCVYDLDDYVGAVVEAKRPGLPVKLAIEVD